jgi:hypothetical protein
MTGPFTWDPRSLRYRDRLGRFVSRVEVRSALDIAIDNAQVRMLARAEDFRAGRISLELWRADTAVSLKQIHLYSAAVARGGWGQMTPADFGRVGQILKKQYLYLDNFTMEIVSGVQAVDGRFLSRVKLYAQSGRATYHAIDQFVQDAAGMTQKRNLLHASESCDECLAMHALGWVDLDDDRYIPIGERTCITNCKCDEEFR